MNKFMNCKLKIDFDETVVKFVTIKCFHEINWLNMKETFNILFFKFNEWPAFDLIWVFAFQTELFSGFGNLLGWNSALFFSDLPVIQPTISSFSRIFIF